MKGIDVSHYNAPIDWNKVKPQIDFAIVKLGNIGDNTKFWLDNDFERNYQECKRLNIPIGVYVYSYTNNLENAKLAGQEVANYVKNLSLDLPVYLDMEDNEIKVEGKQKLSELARVFNAEIEKAGKWAGIYANLDWFNNYLEKDLRERFTTWVAHVEYPNNQDKYKGQFDMFQYSWKGHIDGCSGNNGNVDMNKLYRDLIKEINGGETPGKKKTYTPVTLDNIFDGDLYYSLYPDLQKAFGRNTGALRNHYIKHGIKEGRVASYVFNPDYYYSKYPDLQKAFGRNYKALYDHFINNGIRENRQGSVLFGVDYYRKNNVDLQQAFGEDTGADVRHFINNGIKEFRLTSAEFNVNKYKEYYPDLQKAFGNDCKSYYKHYLVHGIKEGRKVI